MVEDIYIKDNCIYGKVTKPNGKTDIEGLYATSEDYPKDVCNVFNELKCLLNI